MMTLGSMQNKATVASPVKSTLPWLLALITLVMGIGLPVLTGPSTMSAFVNVVWGTVYGLGFWVVSSFIHAEPGILSFITTLIGMIIWPLLVLYGCRSAARTLLQRENSFMFYVAGALLLASFLWNVRIGQIRDSFVFYLPIYSAFMEQL